MTITDIEIDAGGNVTIPTTIKWVNAIPVCFKPIGMAQNSLRSWKWARYNDAIYLVWSTPSDRTLSGIVYYYDI